MEKYLKKTVFQERLVLDLAGSVGHRLGKEMKKKDFLDREPKW